MKADEDKLTDVSAHDTGERPGIPAKFTALLTAAKMSPRPTVHLQRLDAKIVEALGHGLDPLDIAGEIELRVSWMLESKHRDGTSRPPSEVIAAMVDIVVELIGDRPGNEVAFASMRVRSDRRERSIEKWRRQNGQWVPPRPALPAQPASGSHSGWTIPKKK